MLNNTSTKTVSILKENATFVMCKTWILEKCLFVERQLYKMLYKETGQEKLHVIAALQETQPELINSNVCGLCPHQQRLNDNIKKVILFSKLFC